MNMHKLPLVFIVIFTLGLASPVKAEKFSLVRVHITSPHDGFSLMQIGIDLEGANIKRGNFCEIVLSEEQIETLQKADFKTEVLIDDLTKYYQGRFNMELIKGFGLGSMGGFYTFGEVVQQLEEMVTQYPDLITQKQCISTTYEGRDIWVVKISDNPNIDEPDEPEVLYTALHHAREPQSMMVLIYYMWYLLENYGEDEAVTYLVDNREQWFIPVFNPDGYVYNETIEPNGGGLHRKNRFPNGCSGTEVGVDLNRNYGYMWGYDNSGSSPFPCDQTYRGIEAFSELETQAIKDFCLNHDFKLALNYHTYSNLFIHPFGYEESIYPPEPDLSTFREYLNDMSTWNGYQVGTTYETIGYITNGDANDWMYGELGIFTATPEVGNYSDGFWPSTDRIFPLAEENLNPNLYLAWMAGSCFEVSQFDLGCEDYPDPGEDLSIVFSIKNKGLQNSNGNVYIDIYSDSPYLNFDMTILNLGAISSREVVANIADPINTSLGISTPIGENIKIYFNIYDLGGYFFSDSISFRVGTPAVLLYEDAEGELFQWNIGDGWGKSAEYYYGDSSLTDSPDGEYPDDCNNALTLIQSFNLTELSSATLQYWTKWAVEANWDFGQVEISLNGGSTWIPLRAPKMSLGTGQGAQPEGEFGYDGVQNDWLLESISLSEWIGNENIKIRFVLKTDSAVTDDGWYLDNITVFGYPVIAYTPGDVNNDGVINVSDIVRIVNIILSTGNEPTEQELLAGDINSDGDLNVVDIVMIVILILNQGE
ncbi:MAG: immune inhibitor A [Candidatus Marinimicrobia bacterium]|nr:immune inhibitor A [Candidatus Neomarinimicrobiota bacterium]